MAFRVHLLDTPIPILNEGQPAKVNCGAELRKAVMVFFWDVDELGSPEFPPRICKRCAALSDRSEPRARYLYALCEAEAVVELRQEGAA